MEVGNYRHVVWPKTAAHPSSVSKCIVTMEHLVVCVPFFWLPPTHVLPNPLHDIAGELCIDSLTSRDKFLVDDPVSVEKHISNDLTLLLTCRTFFGRSEDGDFHRDNWCFVSGLYL